MFSASTPNSPPETPQKGGQKAASMAVEKGNITSKARSFDASRTGDSGPTVGTLANVPQRSSSQPLENFHPAPRPESGSPSLPQTLSHDDLEDNTVQKSGKTQTDPQLDQNDSDATQDPTEELDESHQAEQETPASTNTNPDEPLEPMDWNDFEDRYRAAMQKANKEEDDLLVEFDAYVTVCGSIYSVFFMLIFAKAFSNWAVAPANHDNERSWKR
jgi:hypothetical protein